MTSFPRSESSIHSHSSTGPRSTQYADAMEVAMRTMMDRMHAAPMTGDPDRDFLAMMIPHHEGAIEMARLILVHGRDALTRQVASEIIAGQQAEIASMRARLDAMSKASGDADYPALTGTRGP